MMKKFLLKLFLFLALLVGVLTLFEIGFRQKPTIFKTKYEGLSQNASNVEVLILGHSHAMEGADPREFSLRTYNMAVGLQNVYYDDYILSKFIARMDSLKFVIISSSFFHFYNTLPDLEDINGEDQFNLAKYHMYWGLDSLKDKRISNIDPQYNIEITSNPTASYIRMFKYYLTGQPWRPEVRKEQETLLGLGYLEGTDIVRSEQFLDDDGVMMVKAHSPHYASTPEFELTDNYYLYEDIVKRCREKGVEVAIVLFPTWHTYHEGVDSFQLDGTRRMMRMLEDEYPNCHAWDHFDDQRFNVGDFQDATHLNRYGAIKMGRILDEEVKKVLSQQ